MRRARVPRGPHGWIYVLAVDDDALEGEHTVTMSHTITASSGRFAGISAPEDVNVNIEDNEKGGVVLQVSSSVVTEVDEGGSLALQVKLTDKPPGVYHVTVNLNASSTPMNDIVTFDVPSIKFGGTDGSPWDEFQEVTMRVASDGGFAYGNRQISVSATAASLSSVYTGVSATLTAVTIRDVNTAGVAFQPTVLTLTEGGASVPLTIRLLSRPTSPVTVAVSKGSPASGLAETLSVTAAENELTIGTSDTAWQTPRTVAVAYGGDGHVTGDISRRLNFTVVGADSTGYNALAYPDAVSVRITDVNRASVTVTPTTIVLQEGKTGSYVSRLGSTPFFDVSLTPTLSPGAPLVFGADSLTMVNTDAVSQTVTTTRDYTQTGDLTFTITHSIASADPVYAGSLAVDSVTVTVIDGDVAAMTVQGSDGVAVTQITVVESAEAQRITVRLATAPLGDVIVRVAEVQDDGVTPATTPFLQLNGVNSSINHTFAEGAIPHAPTTLPLTVDLSRADNDDVEGLQYTKVRFSVDSTDDSFYAAVAPVVVTVTVRDDEAAAVDDLVFSNATEVTEIKDGNVAVSIPPGALMEDKNISVQQLPSKKLQEVPAANRYETKTLVVQYGPLGTVFSANVTITVPVDGEDYCLDPANHCQFLYRPGNTATDPRWEIKPGAVFEKVADPNSPSGVSTVARINVTSFSLYTVAAIKPTVRLVTSTGEASTTVAYTEGGYPVAVASSITGEATAAGAQVIEAKATVDASTYVPGQDALTLIGATCTRPLTDGDSTCTLGANLIPGVSFALDAAWQASGGTLTIRRQGTGATMSPEQAGAVLASIAYTNPSRNPTLSDREVRFTLVEEWSSVTTALGAHTVTITPVNDPPGVNLPSEVLQYTEGQADRKKVAVALTLTDVDSVQMESATAWVFPEVTKDKLWLETEGLALPAASVVRESDFRVRVNGPGSLAAFQEALRRLEYHSTNRHPLNLNRTVCVKVVDIVMTGTVGTKATTQACRSINITTVNDPPELNEQLFNRATGGNAVIDVRVKEDAAIPLGNLFLRADDVEFNPITYAISCQANKGQVRLLNATTGEIDYKPAPNEFGGDVFFAVAVDGFGAQSVPKGYQIDIEAVSDVPIAGNLVE